MSVANRLSSGAGKEQGIEQMLHSPLKGDWFAPSRLRSKIVLQDELLQAKILSVEARLAAAKILRRIFKPNIGAEV
nr:hypothetical protein [uncultured Campylobacter sp.]